MFVNDGEQVNSASIYTTLSASGIGFEAQGQAHLPVEKYDLLSKESEPIAIHENNATVKFNAIIRGRSLKALMLL